HRQLALGRRAVLPAHRQGARRQAHRDRDQIQAGAVRNVPRHAGRQAVAELSGDFDRAGRRHRAAVQHQSAGAGDRYRRRRDEVPLQGLLQGRALDRLRDADLRLHDRRQYPVPARRQRGSRLARGATFPRRLAQIRREGIEDLRCRQRGAGGSGRSARPRRPQLAQADLTMAGNERRLIEVADAAALAEVAAVRLLACMAANPGRIAICLTGGSSPKQLYELLATEDYRKKIPWARVHWFIGDERFVPEGDERNNMAMARRIFLDRFAPSGSIHPIPTDVADTDEAAARYERELKAFQGDGRLDDPVRPLFDLVLMGVGPDGHTASLFPDYPALQETERWVVGVPRAHVEPFVPRVTLTLPALA